MDGVDQSGQAASAEAAAGVDGAVVERTDGDMAPEDAETSAAPEDANDAEDAAPSSEDAEELQLCRPPPPGGHNAWAWGDGPLGIGASTSAPAV